MEMEYGESLRLVRRRKPLVECITNIVTVNDCANIILAAGGSPAMTMDIREVREGVEGMHALVCNMGAMEYIDSMIVAGKRANELGIPVVLDPVACGTTELRRTEVRRLLDCVHFSVIRGNASEIRFLAQGHKTGAGVDVKAIDEVGENNLGEAKEMAAELARRLDTVIAISGKIDIVSDGRRTVVLRNGCPIMSRITGSGCMLTSLAGEFAGADRDNIFRATVSCMAMMGIAGEKAEEKRRREGTGNASFRTYLIDAVYNLEPEEIDSDIRCEEL
jgi:hydroxyethylthiazole kinase